MSRFCVHCGGALEPAARFCGQCGAAADTSPGFAPYTSTTPASQAAQKSSKTFWKVLAIVLGCIMLIFVLAVGTVLFYGYRTYRRVKNSIQAIEMPSTGALPLPSPMPGALPTLPPSDDSTTASEPTPPSQPPNLGPVTRADPKDGQCAVVPKEEMNQLLQANFTQMTQDATGCTYQGPGRGQWTRLEVHWTGGRRMLADMKTNYHDLLRDITSANMPFHPVSGIGDEAFVNATNIYTVRKGDAAISFDLSYFAYSDELCRAAIQRVLARL